MHYNETKGYYEFCIHDFVQNENSYILVILGSEHGMGTRPIVKVRDRRLPVICNVECDIETGDVILTVGYDPDGRFEGKISIKRGADRNIELRNNNLTRH